MPGLNLTACNNVILVDLWWNPALEVCHVAFLVMRRLNFFLGPSIRKSAQNWAEEAGQYMEVDN